MNEAEITTTGKTQGVNVNENNNKKNSCFLKFKILCLRYISGCLTLQFIWNVYLQLLNYQQNFITIGVQDFVSVPCN